MTTGPWPSPVVIVAISLGEHGDEMTTRAYVHRRVAWASRAPAVIATGEEIMETKQTTERPPIRWADELLSEPKVRTVIQDGCVLLKWGKWNSYPIELHRIRSKSAILQWANHLCGKVWMDCDSLAVFIQTVANHNGINIYKPHY
jgi:hypothetical protein